MGPGEWSTLLANLGGFFLSSATIIGFFWAAIRRSQKEQARQIIGEMGFVDQKTYNDDSLRAARIWDEIAQRLDRVERYDIKLGVLEERVANVQSDVGEIKTDVKALDQTITRAILRVGRESST